MSWHKERGTPALEYRTETRFGRAWIDFDGAWRAVRRPEPFAPKHPRWEGPVRFTDEVAARAWVEA